MSDAEHKTLADLEWDQVERAVADRCRGPLGEGLSLQLADSFEETERALAEVERSLDAARPERAASARRHLRDRASLQHLEREGVLDGSALKDIRMTLRAAARCDGFSGSEKTAFRICIAPVPSTRRSTVSKKRSACRSATTARSSIPRARARASSRGGGEPPRSDHSQARRPDPEAKRDPAGLVLHDSGRPLRASGSRRCARTLSRDRAWLERERRYDFRGTTGARRTRQPPQDGPGELEREERKILAALSDLVRQYVPQLRAAAEALDHADLRGASAKLAIDLGAHFVELCEEPRISLRAARHPFWSFCAGSMSFRTTSSSAAVRRWSFRARTQAARRSRSRCSASPRS